MNKPQWLTVAEIIDAYRVVPRLILVGYAWLVAFTLIWYTELEDPTTQQTSFAGTIGGGILAVIGLYVNSGRKWSELDVKQARPYVSVTQTPAAPKLNTNQETNNVGPYSRSDFE